MQLLCNKYLASRGMFIEIAGEAYLGPYETSMMELFSKNIYG